MKLHYLLFFSLAFVLSCKKQVIESRSELTHYQPKGNFLVIQMGDKLEGIAEFYLAEPSLPNDSLPVHSFVYNPTTNSPVIISLHTTNLDTLFTVQGYNSNSILYREDFIPRAELEKTTFSMAYPFGQFQINHLSLDFSVIDPLWHECSHYKIVQQYRSANPNTKIGLHRIVLDVYDEEVGFSIPKYKYFFFLAKE